MSANTRPDARPWPALWALVIGFFMILVDTTIVSVAIPTIMASFGADVSGAIWVSSSYLLAYAVPLLISGRLGDRYGPKRLFLAGLVVFTLASLACGLVGTVTGLIVARVVQGLGASMMSPQTMSFITRLFPASERGKAMALWGAVAGVATLVGPMLGGVLIDTLGWEWIFFINVPVGVVCFALVMRLVPRLEVSPHRFDWLGVALNAVGLFLIVFGIQEGNTYQWGTIAGPITVWGLIVVGALVMVAFFVWQRVNRGEPLLPLELFRDRNFAVSNSAIALVGFAVTSMPFAFMLWAQSARGLSPTQAALLNVPLALVTLVLSPWVGGLVDRHHPKKLAALGTLVWSASLLGLSALMASPASIWWAVVPMAFLGLGSSFVWGPLSTAATGNLPRLRAGAGSGVYNTTRQIGAVLGSAVIATVMGWRLSVHVGEASLAEIQANGAELPAQVRDGVAAAMAEAVLVPAVAIGAVALVALFYERPRHQRADVGSSRPARAPEAGEVN
ncbi:DHA2 family efflux MFS transporter permease subunit [Tessaracoccus sp. OS52]|uniref:DHA2 family efflux MFS transporter permease subunit n=1 Tax=Tessaracoccus sp. OS52 TaxID=2886691 RepID=UPI001D104F48|nr:DHA2 family efflux MFS transporter permease subunit [Tessaracoccus sp. OS52]MCC2594159.1 DHA2 family efflux MFS transporter permease subunit [Tessaracoccus sp. OS52]